MVNNAIVIVCGIRGAAIQANCSKMLQECSL